MSHHSGHEGKEQQWFFTHYEIKYDLFLVMSDCLSENLLKNTMQINVHPPILLIRLNGDGYLTVK